VQRLDAVPEQQIGLPMLRRRTVAPRIVAAGRDLQHTALRCDGPNSLVRFHEFDGIESVSRANQAAASSTGQRNSSLSVAAGV